MTGGPEPEPAPRAPDADEAAFGQILERARADDEMAFRLLYREFNPPLIRFLRARAPSVADDLASDVWATAATALGDFRGNRRQWNAWLFTLAHRRLVDHQRREIRRRTDPEPPQEFLGLAATDDPAGRVVAALSTQELVDDLAAALTPDQAEVILLRVVAQLDGAEVARIMGRSTGWVRVTQHRALRRLVRRYGNEEHEARFLVGEVAP